MKVQLKIEILISLLSAWCKSALFPYLSAETQEAMSHMSLVHLKASYSSPEYISEALTYQPSPPTQPYVKQVTSAGPKPS